MKPALKRVVYAWTTGNAYTTKTTRSLMLRLPTTGSAFRQLTNRSPSVKRGMRLHVVDDSSALVRRRHLARADVKGSYAASRLVGMPGRLCPESRGLLSAPGSPRYALARNLRKPPSSLWLTPHSRNCLDELGKAQRFFTLRQTVEILFVCFFHFEPLLLLCLANHPYRRVGGTFTCRTCCASMSREYNIK